MLVVKVELHSANTGQVTEIGRIVIANDATGTQQRGNYNVYLGRRGNTSNRRIIDSPQRKARVEDYPRITAPVWSLVARALAQLGFK